MEVEKNGDRDGTALYKLMNNAAYGKTKESLRKKYDWCKTCKQRKSIEKSKSIWNGHQNQAICQKKTFANDLVAIPKNKVIFMLNKTAYVVMRILDMNKVLMYEYHNDYIKNKCGNS